MFCPKCGKSVKSDLRYCHFCGYDLHNINDLERETDDENETNYNPDNKLNNHNKTTPKDEHIEPNYEFGHFLNCIDINPKIIAICIALFVVCVIVQSIFNRPYSSNNNSYIAATSANNESNINSEKSSGINNVESTQEITTTVESLDSTSELNDTETNAASVEEDLNHSSIQKQKLYNVGEPAIVGPLEFTLVNAYEAKDEDFKSYKKKLEGATYLVIEYKYKNISKEPISPPDPFTFHIPIYASFEDYNGVTYGSDTDAEMAIGTYSDEKMVSSLNPGITAKNSKVYEIAVETTLQKGNKVKVWYGDKDGDNVVYYTLDDIWNSSNQQITYDNKYAYYDFSEWIFYDSDSRYLTDAEINSLTQQEARMAVNEIAARHGRIFSNSEVRDYFSSKSWYVPYMSAEEYDNNTGTLLNEYESVNTDRLLARKNGEFLPSIDSLLNKRTDSSSNDSVVGEYVSDSVGGAYILIESIQDNTVLNCEWWHIEEGPNFVRDDYDIFYFKENNVWETVHGDERLIYNDGSMTYSNNNGIYEVYRSID